MAARLDLTSCAISSVCYLTTERAERWKYETVYFILPGVSRRFGSLQFHSTSNKAIKIETGRHTRTHTQFHPPFVFFPLHTLFVCFCFVRKGDAKHGHLPLSLCLCQSSSISHTLYLPITPPLPPPHPTPTFFCHLHL